MPKKNENNSKVKVTLEHIDGRLNSIQQSQTTFKESQEKMQGSVNKIQEQLLDPDNGLFTRVRKNTSFRKSISKHVWFLYTLIVASTIGTVIKLIIL